MYALLIALTLAQPPGVPTVSGERNVAAGRLVRLVVDSPQQGEVYFWDVSPDSAADAYELGNQLVFTGTPGAYTVKLRVLTPLAAGGFSQQSVRIACSIGGAGPQPPQPPNPPNPPNPPAPVVGTPPYFLVVVEESKESTAARAWVYSDPVLNARMREKGHKWRIVDQNVVGPDGRPPADVARFMDLARGKALPQLYVVDQKGKLIEQGNLPATPADVSAWLTKLGG